MLHILFLFIFCWVFMPVQAAEPTPIASQDIGITEHVGNALPEDLTFVNEKGEPVRLGSYLHSGMPTLLTLVYYECPTLCNFFFQGLNQSLKELPQSMDGSFQIIHVSIDPSEKPELASMKKQTMIQAYGRSVDESKWHFLTGTADAIRSLASAVGFGYRYDEAQKQFIHTSAIFVVTPDGKIARYLYGTHFQTQDLKFALIEASHGKIGGWLDRLAYACHRITELL